MKNYRILYRFKGALPYNEIPPNEGYINAPSKKMAKEMFIKNMNDAECKIKIIRII
jgi:hypothetical protein